MLELFSANNMEWQKDEIDLWTCKHCLEAALYSHKQRKVSVWNEAEKYGGPQLSRFTNYLRPKPYTLQQNIPNYWECLFQFGAAQPFFTPWPETVEQLWNGFDSDAKLFIYNADIQEFWNFQCQTFYHFSKLISLFSRLCSALENCFANLKTFSRI